MRTIHGWGPLQEEAASGEGGKAAGGTGEGEGKGAAADLGTVEERAARMGWVPKEKFRGDPSKWSDAATYVKNGEESLPILRERMKKLEQTNADLSKSVIEVRKQNDTVYERAYARAKKELQGEIKAAAKVGDDKKVDAATEELATLERDKAARDVSSKSDPVFDAWTKDNEWYKDPELAIEAEAEAFKMRRKGETLEGAPFLEKVKEAVKKRFPEKFGNPRRSQPGSVERSAGGGEDGDRGGKKGWDQLPAEAKEAGERFIKQRLVKDRASYAKQYWDQS